MSQQEESAPIETAMDLQALLDGQGYIAEPGLALVAFLALKMEKPLFLEGEAGVGKTELAKVLAAGLGRRLIRVQCYEGLDVNTVLYEWNYPKQLLAIRMQESGRCDPGALDDVFSEKYLIKRPLLQAIQDEARGERVLLLIDELDRADEEFEAFLLELLSEFQVTIPELGTVAASHVPLVILTSNRTREVHDALKRRCLYHWIDYPSMEKEREILQKRLPGLDARLATQICALMQKVRGADFQKRPGVAESLDWARALMLLHRDHLEAELVEQTMGCLLKHREDQRRFQKGIAGFLAAAVERE